MLGGGTEGILRPHGGSGVQSNASQYICVLREEFKYVINGD